MKSICFLNQKGGVGKTTLAHNTAYILSVIHNKKVLLIDLDQQGNSSELYLLNKNIEPSVSSIFKDKIPNVELIIRKAVVKSKPIITMDIIHSNITLSQALKEIPYRSHKEKILSNALKNIVVNYDYVIIDCPASIEDSVINAIYFSKFFVIPVEMGAFAASAIQDVLELIAEIKEINNLQQLLLTKNIKFVKNKVDSRGSVFNKIIESEIQEILPYTMKSFIRQSLSISRSGVEKIPIIEHSNVPNVVRNDYINFVKELIL